MCGICIGSCVAPIFRVIFLSQADRAIQVYFVPYQYGKLLDIFIS